MVIHPIAFEIETFESKIIYCIAVRKISPLLGQSIGHGENKEKKIRFACIYPFFPYSLNNAVERRKMRTCVLLLPLSSLKCSSYAYENLIHPLHT